MLRRLVLLTALSVIAITSPVRAQWVKLNTFPSPVDAVYFMDQLGASNIGFVGLIDGEIWKTTDNGISWTKMTVSVSFVQDVVQFVFRNTNQGWAAPRSGPLLTTTDGGVTWTASSLNSNWGWVSVGICTASGELLAVDRQNADYKSTDFGTTWTTFGSSNMNGLSFSGMQGITSTYLSTSLLYSTDGGLTWANSNPGMPEEIWSPYLVPNTSTGFAASEIKQDVWRTVNGGASWTLVYNFSPMQLTGTVMGTANAMFLQTTGNGFYYSSNQGTSWNSICGPSAAGDSRFYTRGKEIFASEANTRSLWYNPDGTKTGAGVLSLEKTVLSITGVRCRQTDSMIRIQIVSSCAGGTLVKAQILKGAPSFAVNSVLLPKTINGKDSIAVNYMPSKGLRDTGTLLLEFLNGGVTTDTLITLYGVGSQSVNYSHNANVYLYSPFACSERDSSVIITNLSCDTLTLTSASLSDSSHFQIVAANLPARLGPYGSDTILIRVTSRTDGTFTSLLRLLLQATTGTIRDSIPLRYDVTQGAQALFGSLELAFADRCISLDTSFQIASTPCDSLRLLLASLLDTTVFRMSAISLPMTIPAGGAVVLPIHVVAQPKGDYSTLLHVRYLSGQRLIDTTITVKLKVAADLPVAMHYTYPSLDFGALNVPCEASSIDFSIGDSLCRDMQVTNITIDPADPDFTLDTITFPVTVRSWDSMRVRLHFKPTKTGTFTHNIRVTMRAEDGRTVDTLIPVYAQGISQFKDTLLTPVLRFDTILQCGQQELVGDLINLSCNDIRALRTILGDTTNFEIISPTFPQTIPSGDTLHIRFRLKPERSGSLGDSVTVMVHNPVDGKDYPTKIALSAYVQPIVRKDSLVSTRFEHLTVPPCGSTKDSVTIYNLGTCEDIVINSLDQFGYPGATFDPRPTLPIILHPGDGVHAGDSVKFVFDIIPNVDTKDSTNVHVKGLNIDTTLTLVYQCLPGAHVMILAAKDSVFQTRPCVSVPKHYFITSTGCSDVIVDNVLLAGLTGQTQFGMTGLPKLPVTLKPRDTLRFDITFDPDGTGDSTATLEVRSNQASFARQIALNGQLIGTIPNARLAIVANDMTHALKSPSGVPVAIKVLAVDGIGDSCALQTISFDIRYNWNLLTRGNITFANGWSPVDNTEHDGGLLSITMHKDAAGSIADSAVLAEIPFTTTLGDSVGTDIRLENLHLNATDANYARCILSWQAIGDSVRYTTTDTCGNLAERSLINGNPNLDRISVHPNPGLLSNGHGRTTLTLTLAGRSSVRISVRDMLGREYEPMNYELAAGEQSVDIDLPQASEGAYFVTVEAAGADGAKEWHSRVTRKLLIQGQ